MKRNFKVIGTTKEGLLVTGKLLFGKLQNKKITYYIENTDGEIVPCIKCIEDNPKF